MMYEKSNTKSHIVLQIISLALSIYNPMLLRMASASYALATAAPERAVGGPSKAGTFRWRALFASCISACVSTSLRLVEGMMYEQFFGLDEEPFRLTPDPRYLFLSPKHAEALAHLRLGLTEATGFICITGDVGTGKTTLLRVFLSELGPDVSAAYTFVPPLTALELLRRICREFGLSVSDQTQGELVDELHDYLIAQNAAGRICVLILDEAQALSIDLLEQIRLLL